MATAIRAHSSKPYDQSVGPWEKEGNVFPDDRPVSFARLPSVSGGTDPEASANPASANAAPEYSFAVVRIFPHDPATYTQGLAYGDGFRYAGRGLNGRSSLRKMRLELGEAIQQINLGSEYFGEEITLVGGHVLQLTWKSGTGFECDLEDFRLLRRFCYSGKGWGLATDGSELFLGDGTSEIRVLDAENFKESAAAEFTMGRLRAIKGTNWSLWTDRFSPRLA